MKTIAIIPARGGSKRLPNKNLLLLDGLPLIAHSIRYARQNRELIDEVYVSTDDDAIKNTALGYGAKVIDRPAGISGDNEPTITALQHVLAAIGTDVQTVVLLQPTNPLRPENLLKDCYHEWHKQGSGSLFTVSRNYQKLGRITDGKFVPYNYQVGQRSQDLEPLYYENGLLYICKKELIEAGVIISEAAVPFEVDHIFGTLDIDTQDDLAYAEFLIKNHT